MARLASFLTCLLVVHLSNADDKPFSLSPGLCPGAPQADWSDNIKAYLRSIPNNVTLPDLIMESGRSGAIEVEPAHLHGLGTLWTFKPYYTYCTRNDSFIEVIAFADEPLVFEMNWKMCDVGSGQVGMKATAKQLRLLLKVLPVAEESTHLVLSKIYPDNLENAELFITGVPEAVERIVYYASFFMNHHVEKLWSILFRLDGRFLVSSHPAGEN